jgi:hypothetical protein
MKYLKLFENHKNEEDIHRICEEYNIKNYIINDDLSIDVDGDVYLWNKGLTKLPLKFNKVNGHFNCSYNRLTSLEGAPKEVNRNFNCNNNQLTSLEGAPKKVNRFECATNQLTSFKFSPSEIKGRFICTNNKLFSFEHLPVNIGDYIHYDFNPISCFFTLVNRDIELIYEFNELYVVQKVNGEWSIYKHRMEEFVDMFERPEPNYYLYGKYYKILD